MVKLNLDPNVAAYVPISTDSNATPQTPATSSSTVATIAPLESIASQVSEVLEAPNADSPRQDLTVNTGDSTAASCVENIVSEEKVVSDDSTAVSSVENMASEEKVVSDDEASDTEPELEMEGHHNQSEGGSEGKEQEEQEDQAVEYEQQAETPEVLPTKFSIQDMIAVLDKCVFLCSNVSPSKMPPLEADDSWKKFHRFSTRPPTTTKQTQKLNLGRPQGSQGRLDNKQPWPVRPVPLEPKQRKILFQDAEGDEKIARDFRLQINKIAPENFSKIILKMKDVKITTKEALKKVVDLVTLTAIQQPKYAHTYAEMCEALVKHWEKEGSDPGTNATSDFKKVLLNTMQVYFQSKPPELEGDAAKAYTPEEREKINKERILGTVRFVGELYIRKVIFVNIVRSCIEYLIKPSNDSDLPNTENLESLIKLLTTVGKTLDNKVAIKGEPKENASNKNIVFLDQIFNQLKSLSENPALETRLRMLLQNLKELRGNKWNLRIQEMKATTLSLAAAAPEATFTGVARSQADQRKAPPKDRYEAMLDSPVKEKPPAPAEVWESVKGGKGKAPRRLEKQASEPLAERTKFTLLADDTQEAQSPEASAASVPSVKAVASAEEAKMRLDRCFREYLDAKIKLIHARSSRSWVLVSTTI